MEFKPVKTKDGYEVKTNIKGTWYTIADCYHVPEVGDASETAALIARLLNIHIRKNYGRSTIHKTT